MAMPLGEMAMSGPVVDPGRSNKRAREKRVTWAADDKIREVLLFVSDEEVPVSQSIILGGLAKASSLQVQDPPPGFAAKRIRLQCSHEASMPVETRWESPWKFMLHPAWRVANGFESIEVTTQVQRERRELEAIFPRVTSIPHSPAEPYEPADVYDSTNIPEVPLLPIEDEEEEEEVEEDEEDNVPRDASLSDITQVSNELNCLHDVADPEMAAAVAKALMLVKDPGVSSQVDEELLIKLLRNPSLLQTLASTTGKVTSVHKTREDISTIFGPDVPLSKSDGKPLSPLKYMSSNSNQVVDPSANITVCTAGLLPFTAPLKQGGASEESITLLERSGNLVSIRYAEQASRVTCIKSSFHTTIETTLNASTLARESVPPNVSGSSPLLMSSQGGLTSAQTEREASVDFLNQLLFESHTSTDTGKLKGPMPPNFRAALSSSDVSTKHHDWLPSRSNSRLYNLSDSEVSSSRTESLAQACEQKSNMSSLPSHLHHILHGERHRTESMQAYLAKSSREPQHGLDARDHSVAARSAPRMSNGKSRKQCLYFNTRRGCRKGASCEFLHQTDKPVIQSYQSTSFVR